MNVTDLPAEVQTIIQNSLYNWFGQNFSFDDQNQFFSCSGMQYGYVAIDARTRTILVCDCTTDDGDTIIKTIWDWEVC